MKKFLLVLLSFSYLVSAQESNIFFEEDQLFYEAGVELARHKTIIDWQNLRISAKKTYENIEGVHALFDLGGLFLGADETNSIDEIMDLFESTLPADIEEEFKLDLVTVVAALQDVFVQFNAITMNQPTPEFFIYCTHNRDAAGHSAYNDFYQAIDLFLMVFDLFEERCDEFYFN